MGSQQSRTVKNQTKIRSTPDPKKSDSGKRSSNLATGQNTNDSAQPSTSTAEENRRNTSDKQSHNASEQEKCYDPKDTTLIFVDGEDDHDFECNDYTSLRAKMSCGHTGHPHVSHQLV
ncbi:hypothetical protein PBY51_002817 [Eleginops maclovinus]|uniref:Uncharacterized protein n=1 Tax=Eleginops maclovinus TaxID=56733 RepID=A0AAN7XDJ1_ELEMC|nr:hypothetical protein PBY51_002817 [Eleginops maclovinus]